MKLPRFRDWPVRTKVLAVFCFFSTLPFILTGYVLNEFHEELLIRNAPPLLEAKCAVTRVRLDELHQRNIKELELMIRTTIILQLAKADPDAPRPIIEKILGDFLRKTATTYKELYRDDLLGMAVIDPSGKIIKKTDDIQRDRIDLKRSLNQYLKDAIQEGKAKISDLYYAPEAGNKPAVAYAQPVKNKDGKAVFLIVLWVKAEAFWNILADFHKEYGQRFGYLSLFDQHGIRIGHSFSEQMPFIPGGDVPPGILQRMIDEQRFGPETKRLNEKKYFLAQFERATDDLPNEAIFKGFARANAQMNVGVGKRLKSVKWTVFCMVPEDKLAVFGGAELTNVSWFSFFEHYGLSLYEIGVILIIALLGPFAGMWIAGQFLKPVRTLSKTIKKFGAGDFASRVPITSNDELGALGAGFNHMADQLQATVRSLHHALAAQAASEARLRAIMETVGDGIVTITREGKIESFNNGAALILGYQPEEVLGQSVWMLLVRPTGLPQDQPLTAILDAALAEATTFQREVEGKHKDGRRVPIEMALGKVQVGDVELFTASFHDLTSRKHAEEEIYRARDAAEEANRAKSQFLATMSHELRTPLTAIIGYTEILQEEIQEIGQHQMASDLEKIHAQSKHLLTLINDVLDMSKIEAGKMELFLETFDLAKVLPDVANIVQPLMVKNANRLEVHAADGSGSLGMMHTDLTRLRQCLFNLLSNAAKFTERGTITLSVTRETSAGEDWINFQVRDTGIGMTNEQIQKIFRPFAQADLSTARKYGGTGLGLAITRMLCQMMGGDVTIASDAGVGSTFTLRLPAIVAKPEAEPAATGASPIPISTDTLPKPGENTVLVVDDDPAVLDMLTRFLTKEGFRVVTASRGEDCVPLAKKVRPRAITLDVMMPGMDGWTVLAALKADRELADIPVIILSIVEDKNLGAALGAVDYLVKPLDRDRLLEVLKNRSSPSSPLALVAEDDPATREILRRHLEKDGWTVVEAVNGRQALECVAKQKPALVLLDLMMPEMDGFEFISELSQHPEWRNIPVIVITAKDLTEEDRMFLNGSMLLSGSVKRVLQKGKFNRDELLKEVHELVVNS